MTVRMESYRRKAALAIKGYSTVSQSPVTEVAMELPVRYSVP